MATYKYRDIRDIIDNTDWDDMAFSRAEQPHGHTIGYFTPSNSNWSYVVKIVQRDSAVYEVVTVFGQVEGYQRLAL